MHLQPRVFADQQPGKKFPLGDFLNPDGSLDPRNDFNGSLDRADGAQRHALGKGMGGKPVEALAVAGADLYAGGWFRISGGITPANYVARWGWSAYLEQLY